MPRTEANLFCTTLRLSTYILEQIWRLSVASYLSKDGENSDKEREKALRNNESIKAYFVAFGFSIYKELPCY
jgi:hypothetical protein